MVAVWLVALFIWGALFGWIGVAIAQNKGVSSAAGFWLGAFLGPIGLVIVALLSPPREEPAQQSTIPQKFEGERLLSNDAYKLWLTARYDIKRNDVLDSYVIGERLFPTVQAALEHAKGQQETEIAAAEAEERRKAEEREKQREAARKAYEEADAKFQRWKPYLIFIGTLVFIGFCYLMYLAAQDAAEQQRIGKQKAAEAKRKHDALIAPVNAMLAPYGVAIGDNANEPVTDEDENSCIFSTKSQQTKKISGKKAQFVTATYPPNQTVGDVKLTPAGDWQSLTGALDTSYIGLDNEWLFKNKRTGTEVFITSKDETNYQAPAGDLTFRTRVRLCVGKEISWN